MFFSIIENSEDMLEVERIYNKYSKLLYKVAFEILNDQFSSEDAVQQSFLRVIKYHRKIDYNDSVKMRNLLITICKNVSIDILKSKNKFKSEDLTEEIVDTNESVLNLILNQENLDQLTHNIRKLSPNYQEVIILRYSRNFSISEISILLDLDIRTVQKRIERAKTKLLQILSNERMFL